VEDHRTCSRFVRAVRVALLLALVAFSGVFSNAQARKRIAILGFDDRNIQTRNMALAMGNPGGLQLGQRVTNELISALVGAGPFEVVERASLDRILSEQTQGYGDRFSPEGAARIGKLVNAEFIIIGQVDAFSANVSRSSKSVLIAVKTTETGVVTLQVTARVIPVETGTILSAPSVTSEQKAVFSQNTSPTPGLPFSGLGGAQPNPYAFMTDDTPLMKLVNLAVKDSVNQLSAKIVKDVTSVRSAPVLPKFVGTEDGLIVVNKGQKAGIKVGDKFSVVRPTDTGMKDPDTGQAIIRKKKQCVLTITVVEDTISSGKCDGDGVPQAGDEFAPVPNQ